jgi:hypothetical protein
LAFRCHGSQVQPTSYFFTTYVAEDPVLVACDGSGWVHTFFNVCRHRGSQQCRADGGEFHPRLSFPDTAMTAVDPRALSEPGLPQRAIAGVSSGWRKLSPRSISRRRRLALDQAASPAENVGIFF